MQPADEGTIDGGVAKRRQTKIYSDVLGRTVKTEILNWQGGSVYSATVNTYNVRDQVTQVREYAGPSDSGTYQDTTMTYDGYGRLKTKHVPEQDAGTSTTWTYNADDTIQQLTDARGAATNYAYNNRHLLTGISYNIPQGSQISCQTFMKTILNNASTNGNPVLEGGDIQKIFADFLAQKGGGISRQKLTRFGSASGKIGLNGKGNGTLHLPLYQDPGPKGQDWQDASGIVNELPHIAGSQGGWPLREEYDDYALAVAGLQQRLWERNKFQDCAE